MVGSVKKGYRIAEGGSGQKQGYGWICPSQHPLNDTVFADFDKAFVVERNVKSPAKTRSLSRIRILVFMKHDSFLFG
jgi:hypothetical protein